MDVQVLGVVARMTLLRLAVSAGFLVAELFCCNYWAFC